jgi:ABC-type bacteriocin/lantibiotic exporter with double-glycine peptidase domain
MVHLPLRKGSIKALHNTLRQKLKPRQKSFACVRQFSEEDCGAACIATVSAQHGRELSLGKVREAVGTMANGTTLLGLKRGAESLGFIARAAKTDASILQTLDKLPLPIVNSRNGSLFNTGTTGLFCS